MKGGFYFEYYNYDEFNYDELAIEIGKVIEKITIAI
jgi:hypothetical protein